MAQAAGARSAGVENRKALFWTEEGTEFVLEEAAQAGEGEGFEFAYLVAEAVLSIAAETVPP